VNRFEVNDEILEEGRTMLDGLYFALVENVRTATEAHVASQQQGEADPAVPRLLLDAIVEATGKLQLSERAFSVFQEYTPVFRVTPDVNSYNALLSSCAQQRKVVISAIFAIFQEMEANNIEANEESFSILLQAITTCKEFDIYEQVRSLLYTNRPALSN
jgi:pentatricopeptide repeat protein